MKTAIPNEWQGVLKSIREVFPSAVIAGGALRDLFNERPIKDVDIFVPVIYDKEGSLDHLYEKVWDLFAGENITLDQNSVYGIKTTEEDDRDLYAIFRLIRKDWSYDIILCDLGASKVENFDINLCQIAYDGKELITTRAYWNAVQDKTLRVMNVNRTDRNKARLERLHQKYQDFEVEAC